MTTYSNTTAAEAASEEIQAEFQRKFMELLESKHLYQRVKIDLLAVAATHQAMLTHQSGTPVRDLLEKKFDTDITLIKEGATSHPPPIFHLITRNVKLYCSVCGEREVFSCIWSHDLGEVNPFTHDSLSRLYPQEKNWQGFFLAYQCQRCKSDPTLFIVRREKLSLTLEGRSPIEEVQVPDVIPKAERPFFRDSVVAFQSGKALPGILYLRVFIEAFCRRVTGITTRETGDELTDRYNKLLPPDQSSQMPSLKVWYGKLSDAIHEGREDFQLYEEARDELIRHFEFRRLYRINDAK